MTLQRLQKVLAAAGLGSRRSCEELISQGRVSVDGRVVGRMGVKVDTDSQEIRCDGERVRPARKVYFLVNKPKGVVCTNDDERNRPRVLDLLPHRAERLFTVGRLDAGTEGLLIVTNDGAFTQRVAHPRHGITKTYHARVRGRPGNEALTKLLDGLWIDGRKCRAVHARVLGRKRAESEIELIMQEGRKHEVRRMLACVGHGVLRLQRVRIGALEDPDLRPGKWRKLTPAEVKGLLDFKPETRARPRPAVSIPRERHGVHGRKKKGKMSRSTNRHRRGTHSAPSQRAR